MAHGLDHHVTRRHDFVGQDEGFGLLGDERAVGGTTQAVETDSDDQGARTVDDLGDAAGPHDHVLVDRGTRRRRVDGRSVPDPGLGRRRRCLTDLGGDRRAAAPVSEPESAPAITSATLRVRDAAATPTPRVDVLV